jgi:hypothetical protein
MQLRDHGRPLADRRADALDGARPHVADGEDATHARLERQPPIRTIVASRIGRNKTGARLHKSRLSPKSRRSRAASRSPDQRR